MDNIPSSTYEAPRGRLLPTLVMFVFVLGLFYTLYLVFSSYSLKHSVASLETSKNELQNKIEILNDQQIQELYDAQLLIDKIQENSIHWSQVLTTLNSLTPVGVYFSNYGLTEDGAIQLSGYGDNYDSVADLISAMEKSEDFVGPFVPAIAKGTASDGQSIVSFSLSIQLASEQ